MITPGGGSSIGYTQITQAKNAVQDTAVEMSRQVKVLADTIATVAAGWTGVGASQFVTVQKELNTDHDDIRRKLDILFHAVGQTKNLNQGNDEEVDAAFRAINVGGAAGGGSVHPSGLNAL